MTEYKIPTLEDIKLFLTDYGWHFQESTADGDKKVIISALAPPSLRKDKKGIIISFHLEGEFVMVSTVNFMRNVPLNFSRRLLAMNDTIKCVKIFSVEQKNSDKMDVDVGFELWKEAWDRGTFFAFMDALGMAIEVALESLEKENIPHETGYANFE